MSPVTLGTGPAALISIVALGVLANPAGIKAAGGVIAQVLPGADERTIEMLERRALAMPPVTTQIDAGASVEDLVTALAGDLDVRFTRTYALRFSCTCSRERVERVLMGLGEDELRKIASEQNEAEAVCEFCKTKYVLSRDEVRRLIEKLAARR